MKKVEVVDTGRLYGPPDGERGEDEYGKMRGISGADDPEIRK